MRRCASRFEMQDSPSFQSIAFATRNFWAGRRADGLDRGKGPAQDDFNNLAMSRSSSAQNVHVPLPDDLVRHSHDEDNARAKAEPASPDDQDREWLPTSATVILNGSEQVADRAGSSSKGRSGKRGRIEAKGKGRESRDEVVKRACEVNCCAARVICNLHALPTTICAQPEPSGFLLSKSCRCASLFYAVCIQLESQHTSITIAHHAVACTFQHN